eukprot:81770-Prymnesium_polylepis.1
MRALHGCILDDTTALTSPAQGVLRVTVKSLRRRATTPPRRYGGCPHTIRHHSTVVMLNIRS